MYHFTCLYYACLTMGAAREQERERKKRMKEKKCWESIFCRELAHL